MVTLVSENSAVMCDTFSCSCACCKRIMQLRLSDTVKRFQLGACSTTHFGERKRIQAKESVYLQAHSKILHVQIALAQLGDELLLSSETDQADRQSSCASPDLVRPDLVRP